MTQQHKYLLILKTPNRSEQRLETDDDAEALDQLIAFRMMATAHRIEMYARGLPGFDWWDQNDYHFEAE